MVLASERFSGAEDAWYLSDTNVIQSLTTMELTQQGEGLPYPMFFPVLTHPIEVIAAVANYQYCSLYLRT